MENTNNDEIEEIEQIEEETLEIPKKRNYVQTEARKLASLPDELKDLSANETNLDWLKEKASHFYKQENS